MHGEDVQALPGPASWRFVYVDVRIASLCLVQAVGWPGYLPAETQLAAVRQGLHAPSCTFGW